MTGTIRTARREAPPARRQILHAAAQMGRLDAGA